MAKGYVIVDMPECCSECQLCTYEGDVNSHMGFFCDGSVIDGFGFSKIPDEIVYHDLKPDWCPIKEFPEKYDDVNVYEPDFGEFRKGYNKCLKEILNNE